MSLSEVCCQICGVSFNIGCYPTKSEVDAGFEDSRWRENTRVLRAQVRGFCGEGCFMCILVDSRPGDTSSHPNGRKVGVKSLQPISSVKRRRFSEDEQHISGPACSRLGGYSSNNISAEELRGSCTFQCFFPKPKSRRNLLRPISNPPQPKTADDYILSGISDSMANGGFVNNIYPLEPYPATSLLVTGNWFATTGDMERIAMPFHPTCLEVYKRASLHRHGFIDTQGLTDWFRLEAKDPRNYHDFPRHPRVRKAKAHWANDRAQLWLHHGGSEFLAANPCFVPMLSPIIDSAAGKRSPPPDPHPISQSCSGQAQSDEFLSRLPIEIRLSIAGFLGATDIANLQWASRAFHDLPQHFYRQLILRECPWLWEAWCSLPYSFLTGGERWELQKRESQWKASRMQLQVEISRLREEIVGGADPEKQIPKIKALEERISEADIAYEETRIPIPAQRLPHQTAGVDWYGLYRSLVMRLGSLKGLRNRRRIWKDCEEILDRIEKYRAQDDMRPALAIIGEA